MSSVDPKIESFLASIRTTLPAYRHPVISFVAVVHEGWETVLRARLRLSVVPDNERRREETICQLRAAKLDFPMEGVHLLLEYISTLMAGDGILAGTHMLRLRSDMPGNYSPYYETAAQAKHSREGHRERLLLSGITGSTLINPYQGDIERGLQSNAYDSLDDLLQDYGFEGFGHSGQVTLEIAVDPVAQIEPRSKLEGNVAEVSVLLALGLSPESFQLSVRNADRTAEPRRRILAGHEFEWTDVIDHRRGVISFEVQRGSIVECRALYGGCCHDTREIADVSILPNERRMIVELNDPGLARMLEVVTTIRERDDKLRNEFESIVAVLLYMLGFEAVRIGGTRKLTDGPDIYASTPAGELLVIECTSGAFSEEKLGKLMARTKDARAKLDQLPDGQNGFNVTAAMVTPRTREELGDTLAKAEKQGVLVLCGPELLAGFDRTRFYPNADQILKEWRQGALLRFLANPTRE